MIKKVTWNIERVDGRYLGQAAAFSPQTAFCECMFVLGTKVAFDDVRFEQMENGAGKITYQSEEFILTPIGSSS